MEDKNIEDHKKALMMSGNLSDFQIVNLRNYPQIVFNDIENYSLNFNFYRYKESGEREVYSGKVEYDINFKEGYEESNEQMDFRKTALETFVKSLFWEDTEVSLKKNGEKWN